MVACVDGEAVLASDVVPHLRAPAPIRGQAALPDPRQTAVDEAVRLQLFAAEARRRGLADGGGPRAHRLATLNQALRRDELARLHLGPNSVSDDVTQAFFAANPGAVSPIDAVRVRAIVVADAARAEVLYREAGALDDDGFAALARTASLDASAASGGDLGEVSPDRHPLPLVRAAFDLRAAGELGGPIALGDGRYAILRATTVTVRKEDFATIAPRVKAHLARVDEASALDALAARLRAERPVTVFADAVAQLAEPTR